MSNATPPPMTAVEPVLMFRASCYCGWWKITPDEDNGINALYWHTLETQCDGCTVEIDHDSATVHDQGDWAGAFCKDCAADYAPAT